jgi:hypothetical protein
MPHTYFLFYLGKQLPVLVFKGNAENSFWVFISTLIALHVSLNINFKKQKAGRSKTK